MEWLRKAVGAGVESGVRKGMEDARPAIQEQLSRVYDAGVAKGRQMSAAEMLRVDGELHDALAEIARLRRQVADLQSGWEEHQSVCLAPTLPSAAGKQD